MQAVTTAFSTVMEDTGSVLSGIETYPIMGDKSLSTKVAEVFSMLSGLNRYWDCLKKAEVSKSVFEDGMIAIGSLFVWSGDYKSSYGYAFNPPFEFHAWLVVPDIGIVDMALAGVIEKGLTVCDDIGPCLVDRKPVVLVGKPEKWLQYRPVKYIMRPV